MRRDFSGLNDVDMLARIIEAEAASEPLKGKVAVGAVIDNRRKTGAYGNGWRGVITAPGQFSAINDVTGYARGQGANSLFWKEPSRESIAVAQRIISGDYRDPTGGATHYYNPTIANPDWARGKKFAPIGNHVFGRADAGRRGTRVADSGQTAADAMSALEAEILNSYASKAPKAPSFKSLEEEILNAYSRPQAQPERAPVPKPAERQSLGEGLMDMVTQGVTAGQGRKLTALESAILGREPGGGTFDLFNYEQPFWDRYNAAMDAEGGQQAQFHEEHPYLATGTEIAGAIGPAVLTGGATVAPQAAGLASRAAGVATRVGSGIMRNTPAGIAGRVGAGGATRGGQFARAGAAGAGYGALYGESEAEREGALDRGLGAAQGAAWGLGGGLVGQQLSITAGNLLSRLVGNSQYFKNGTLTEAGRQALRNHGVDPDQISDEFARAWAARIKQAGGATDETVRMAQADEFGIPLTRGQATGDESLIAFEEAARKNARGALAKGAVQGIDDAARQRVGQTVDNIAGSPDDALGAAERTGGLVQGAARRAERAGSEAYKRAEAAGPMTVDRRAFEGGFAPGSTPGGTLPTAAGNTFREAFGIDSFRGLTDRVDEALKSVTLGKPSGLVANALDELKALTDNVASAPDGTIGVDFRAVERIRSKLASNQRNARKNDNQVAEELGTIIGALDDWTDDVVDRALISGSDDALSELKKARATWKDYKQKFGQYQGKDADLREAQRMIEQIAERDLTGGEIANWLWGASKIGGKGSSVRLVRRLNEVLPPAERDLAVQAIKAGAWRRVAESSTGEPFGLKRMAERIKDFTTGDGRALAAELFTQQERAQMLRFARTLEIMVPPPSATNPSNTSYGIARLGQDMMRGMAVSMGIATGGPAGGLGALMASAVAKNTPDALRAMRVPAARALRPEFQRKGRAAGSVAGGIGGAKLGDTP